MRQECSSCGDKHPLAPALLSRGAPWEETAMLGATWSHTAELKHLSVETEQLFCRKLRAWRALGRHGKGLELGDKLGLYPPAPSPGTLPPAAQTLALWGRHFEMRLPEKPERLAHPPIASFQKDP